MAMNMQQAMKQAQKMQMNLAIAQKELSAMEFEGVAGGGMVKVVVDGDNVVKSVTLEKMVVDPEDIDLLQDMIVAAVNDALKNVKDTTNERMSQLTGGLHIPGLM